MRLGRLRFLPTLAMDRTAFAGAMRVICALLRSVLHEARSDSPTGEPIYGSAQGQVRSGCFSLPCRSPRGRLDGVQGRPRVWDCAVATQGVVANVRPLRRRLGKQFGRSPQVWRFRELIELTWQNVFIELRGKRGAFSERLKFFCSSCNAGIPPSRDDASLRFFVVYRHTAFDLRVASLARASNRDT